MVDVNEEYVKDRCYFLEKNTGKENDKIIFVVPKSKIRILDRMKKKTENTCISSLIFFIIILF